MSHDGTFIHYSEADAAALRARLAAWEQRVLDTSARMLGALQVPPFDAERFMRECMVADFQAQMRAAGFR